MRVQVLTFVTLFAAGVGSQAAEPPAAVIEPPVAILTGRSPVVRVQFTTATEPECPGGRCAIPRAGAKAGEPLELPPVPLPAGWSWEDTAEGYGLKQPDGSWYKTPDPEHKRRVRIGMCYVPMPECNGYPLGYWRGVCVREGSCTGPIYSCVYMGQDGKPVDRVGQAAEPPFDPTKYPGGLQITPKKCPPISEVVIPIPFDPRPFLPPVEVSRR